MSDDDKKFSGSTLVKDADWKVDIVSCLRDVAILKLEERFARDLIELSHSAPDVLASSARKLHTEFLINVAKLADLAIAVDGAED